MSRNQSTDSNRPFNYESVAGNEKGVPVAQRKGSRKWLVLGAIAAIIVVGAAVGLGVGLTRNKNNNNKSSAGGGSGSPGDASSAINAKSSVGRFATGTDPFYLYPDYPSTVRFFFS